MLDDSIEPGFGWLVGCCLLCSPAHTVIGHDSSHVFGSGKVQYDRMPTGILVGGCPSDGDIQG